MSCIGGNNFHPFKKQLLYGQVKITEEKVKKENIQTFKGTSWQYSRLVFVLAVSEVVLLC